MADAAGLVAPKRNTRARHSAQSRGLVFEW